MNKLLDKINARLESRKSGDEGSMLFDVLLGMAIFALIAVIGILSAGKLRDRAYVIQATADASQLRIGIEGFVTGNVTAPAVAGTGSATYPNGGTGSSVTNQTPLGVNLTNGNQVRRYAYNATTGVYTFCIVRGTDGAWAYYDSAVGRISNSGTTSSGAYNATTNPCAA